MMTIEDTFFIGSSRFVDEVGKAEHIIVVTHVSPDGDAIGSAGALALALGRGGKRATLVLPEPVPEPYRFLPLEAHAVATDFDPDLIVVVDCENLSRVGGLPGNHRRMVENTIVINIDHHDTNAHFGEVNIVRPDMSSTSEIVFHLLHDANLVIDGPVADCLLTGIVADTERFRYRRTSASTLHIATSLIEKGGRLYSITQQLGKTLSLGDLLLWGAVLQAVQVSRDGCLVWSRVTKAMLAKSRARDPSVLGRLVNFLLDMKDCRIAVLFREASPRYTKVSVRTEEGIDATQLATHFGGGGHARAAGFAIPAELGEAEHIVIDYVREFLGSQQASEGPDCTALPS